MSAFHRFSSIVLGHSSKVLESAWEGIVLSQFVEGDFQWGMIITMCQNLRVIHAEDFVVGNHFGVKYLFLLLDDICFWSI